MRTKSYRTTRGLLSTPARLATAVLAVIVLLFLILRLSVPTFLTALTTPVQKFGTSLTSSVGATLSLDSRIELIQERDRLLRENEALRIERATLGARAEDLQRLLGTRSERVGGILAGVIVRPPLSPYDVLVVDQGSDSGVRVGALAYGPGGVPLGIVTEATAKTARVTLYSHTGNVTEGWAGETRIPVKLTGTGAGGFDAEIPGTAGAEIGDLIYVAGGGALPIATITDVVTDPSSPSVVLRIQAMVNPFSITWVTIE